jgi:hypothetical protein
MRMVLCRFCNPLKRVLVSGDKLSDDNKRKRVQKNWMGPCGSQMIWRNWSQDASTDWDKTSQRIAENTKLHLSSRLSWLTHDLHKQEPYGNKPTCSFANHFVLMFTPMKMCSSQFLKLGYSTCSDFCLAQHAMPSLYARFRLELVIAGIWVFALWQKGLHRYW